MTVEAFVAAAATVLVFWIPASFGAGGILALAGYRRKLIRPVNTMSQFGQHVGHDLSELGGLSQSNHNGGIAA